MQIPFEPKLFGIAINIHLVLEYASFFFGFRYYKYLKSKTQDTVSNQNRLSSILGAVIGAFLGSRIMGYLENPISITVELLPQLINLKTIMGGLFGGLLGVEIAKKIISEKQSTGDLYTLPIILGIFIGRIGCFLMGIDEFTYGIETTFWLGMDLGDGKMRHPLALYELCYLIVLFGWIHYRKGQSLENGSLFKEFMIAYFGFRFVIEFWKPNQFFILGLSSIQWLCIICWCYYSKYLAKLLN